MVAAAVPLDDGPAHAPPHGRRCVPCSSFCVFKTSETDFRGERAQATSTASSTGGPTCSSARSSPSALRSRSGQQQQSSPPRRSNSALAAHRGPESLCAAPTAARSSAARPERTHRPLHCCSPSLRSAVRTLAACAHGRLRAFPELGARLPLPLHPRRRVRAYLLVANADAFWRRSDAESLDGLEGRSEG